MTTALRVFTVGADSATFGIGSSFTVSFFSTLSQPTSTSVGLTTDSSAPSQRTASTTSALSASASATAKSSSPSTGQTVGITVGVVVGACLFLCLIFVCCWRRRRKASTRRVTAHSANPTRNLAHPYQVSNQNQPSRHAVASRQNTWPRSINPEEIGVAIIPSERQGFIKRLTNPKPQPRSMLPISAPISTNRFSMRQSFQDRFFAEPPPVPLSAKRNTKHISDATTIRTSYNPPTPSRPPIAVLRPTSTRTSTGTTFEEDFDYQANDIPPMPTFTAVEIPLASLNVQKRRDKPSRLDLEAGIKKNLSKAMSHVPMTPMYGNGNIESSKKSKLPLVPKSRLRGSQKPNTQPPKSSEAAAAFTAPSMANLSRPRTPSPGQESLESIYPDIPGRESSLRNFQMKSDEEWLLQGSNTTTPYSANSKALRPPPLSLKNTKHSQIASPIRNLTYPRVPASASETNVATKFPVLQSPFQPRTRPAQGASVSAENIERYSNKPLPPVVVVPTDMDDPFEGPSNNSRSVKPFQTPSRIYIPATSTASTESQGTLRVYSTSDFVSSRAILTPNRTNTGDLVLLVNM